MLPPVGATCLEEDDLAAQIVPRTPGFLPLCSAAYRRFGRKLDYSPI